MTKCYCDICGVKIGFFSNYSEVYIKSNDPELADTRYDVCATCRRRLKKYIKTIKKEKTNDQS